MADDSPPPSKNEIDAAMAGREVVGASASTIGQLLLLKLAFRTGDSTTICMRPKGAERLSQAVKQFLQTLPKGTESAS
jgi:hypothetical protein